MSRLRVALSSGCSAGRRCRDPGIRSRRRRERKTRFHRRRGWEASSLHRQSRRNRTDEGDQPPQRSGGIRTRMVT